MFFLHCFVHCTVYSVIGMDGCSVNTGIHTGAITLTELNIGDVVQHDICGPHLNELVFWHLLAKIDGVTKGPGSLSGPLGSTLHQDNWKDPIVSFKPIPGKVSVLPDEVLKDLILYRYTLAIQTGAPKQLSSSELILVRAACVRTKAARTKKGDQTIYALSHRNVQSI